MQASHDSTLAAANAAYTLQLNGVDTALTCTVLAGTRSGSDHVNTVLTVAGDVATMKDVQSTAEVSSVLGPRVSVSRSP